VSTLNTALWYAARGTGVVALVLFTLVVLLGILTRSGRTVPGLSGFVTAGFHRNASLVALGFLVIHIVSSIIDPFASIKIVDAFVPFVASYRPIWLGLGAVAFDLVLAIVITSLLRNRIGRRTWRGLHWFTYAMWPIAVVHSLGTGSDSAQPWMVGLVAVCVSLVVIAALWRIILVSHAPVAARAAAVTAVLVGPMALAIFAVLGPLAPHWSIRAGTPASVLASSGPRIKTTTHNPTTTVAAVKVPAGTVNISGKVTTLQQTNGVAVVLDGNMSSGSKGQFRIILRGQPAQGGGISLSDGTVQVAPSTGGLWQGSVVSLNGGTVQAQLTGPKRTVNAVTNLTLDSTQTTFQGTVTFS